MSFILIDGRAFAQTSAEQRAIPRRFERSVAEYATQFEWSTEQQVPAVAPVVFSVRVDRVPAAHRDGVGRLAGPHNELAEPAARPPSGVYAPFPLADSALPSQVVLDALPALPARLEYRLVAGDLVLRDTQLDTVVAVLHDAIRNGANRLLTHGR